jgi:DNA-binding transcriptional MocR family regulator
MVWVERYGVAGTRASEIAAEVEAALTAGRLTPGLALPTVRDLAGQLGVNPNTAASAYRLLRERGTVETHGRNGTRIRTRPATTPATRVLTLPPGTVDLSTGDPDPALLPRLTPRPMAQPLGYRHDSLDAALLRRAGRILERDGVDPAHLTCTFGALDGIDRVLTACLQPGDSVAVEDPGWAHLLDLLAADRLTPISVPIDNEGPQPAGLAAALRGGAKAFIMTTRAQNPYGAATSPSRAAALRAVLAEYPEVLTIDDDHGADLCAEPPHTLTGVTRHWAYVRSASKAYGPDLRIALLAADEATHSRVTGRLRHTARNVSHIIQAIWADALADPRTQQTIGEAAADYLIRRQALEKALIRRGLEAHAHTGLNVWVPVADESAALSALVTAGYAAAPGVWFRLRSGPGLRITIATLDPAHADRVAAALDGHGAP